MKKILFALVMLFLLSNCKNEIDCISDDTCLNGGTCVDGKCVCPDGYEGATCENQKMPIQMLIVQNTMTFEKYNTVLGDGSGFDPNDGPDPVFFVRNDTNGDTLYIHEESFNNVEGEILNFQHNEIIIENIQDQYQIGLMDYDLNAKPELLFMSSIASPIYQTTTIGFPERIEWEFSDMKLSFEVAYSF